MLQFLRIAARNLLAHRLRTTLIGGAIVVVTTLLVLLLSLTAGIQRTILRNATALASGHVNIAGFHKLSQTSATAMVTDVGPLLEMAKTTIPEAEHIYLRLKSFGKIISDSGSITAPMWGVDMQNEKSIIGNLKTAEGDILELEKRGTIAIFATHAKKLKVKVGDTVTVSLPTYRNIYNTKDVRVVAVLADMGLMSAFTTFMNEGDSRELTQVPETATGQIMIALKNADDMPKVEERLRKKIAEMGRPLMDKEEQPYWMKFDRVSGESWTGQRIDVTTWKDETAYIKWVLSLLSALTFVFISILLIIVSLGLINTLWMAIRQRTGEVGTLRAIGLQRSQVLVMFLLEALILCVGGVFAGILVGLTTAGIINAAKFTIEKEAFQMFLMSNRMELAVQPGDLMLTFGMLSFILVVVALFPAYRASKMKPVTAIQYVST